jgi:preprotein translocase subunit SecY
LIVVSRVGVYVRIPGVDVDAFSAAMQSNGLLGYVDALSGGSISKVRMKMWLWSQGGSSACKGPSMQRTCDKLVREVADAWSIAASMVVPMLMTQLYAWPCATMHAVPVPPALQQWGQATATSLRLSAAPHVASAPVPAFFCVQVGLFSLGIIPYINASIVLQLMSAAFPSLKKMQREDGPQGRARFQYYQKLAAFVFAIAQVR